MKALFALLSASILLLTGQQAQAQSADIPRHGSSVTGLNDPEPAEPRYMPAGALALLKQQAAPEPDTLEQEKQPAKQAEPARPTSATPTGRLPRKP